MPGEKCEDIVPEMSCPIRPSKRCGECPYGSVPPEEGWSPIEFDALLKTVRRFIRRLSNSTSEKPE